MAKPSNENPKLESVTPRSPVNDVEKALASTHGNVCRDSISMDLMAMPRGRRGPAMAYIQLKGVDAYFSELKRRNLGPDARENRPYGMRDFEVVDPDLCPGRGGEQQQRRHAQVRDLGAAWLSRARIKIRERM